MMDVSNDYTALAGKIMGGVLAFGGAAYGILKKLQRDKVETGNQALDLTSLDSASKQILNLSNQLDKAREDAVKASDIAQKRFLDLQTQLDAAQVQIDAERVKRRTAEDTIGILRAQIRSLGAEPTA